MQGCICAGAGKSTGRPGCTTPRGITTYLVIGQWKNDSGNINSIPQGTVIDQTDVEGHLNSDKAAEVEQTLHQASDSLATRMMRQSAAQGAIAGWGTPK